MRKTSGEAQREGDGQREDVKHASKSLSVNPVRGFESICVHSVDTRTLIFLWACVCCHSLFVHWHGRASLVQLLKLCSA